MTHLTGHSSKMNPNVLHGIVGLAALLIVGGGIYFFTGSAKAPLAAVEYCNNGTLSDTAPIQSHRSYCFKSNLSALHIMPKEPVSLEFSIVDDQGNVTKEFQAPHEMLLHIIVVSSDLASFQHLHPDFNATSGKFTLSKLTFPTAGAYRIYADFVPKTAQMGPDGMPLNVVLTQDANVMGNYAPQVLSVSSTTKTFDGYTVSLATNPKSLASGSMGMLSFTIKKDGKLITDLQPYLAALGHGVVIREGSLDYIHAHAIQEPSAAQTGTIDFHTDLPYGGTYKIFMQFKHGDKVITTDFVVPVSGETPTTSQPEQMQGMDHSMH